jgi:hypothetical protein
MPGRMRRRCARPRAWTWCAATGARCPRTAATSRWTRSCPGGRARRSWTPSTPSCARRAPPAPYPNPIPAAARRQAQRGLTGFPADDVGAALQALPACAYVAALHALHCCNGSSVHMSCSSSNTNTTRAGRPRNGPAARCTRHAAWPLQAMSRLQIRAAGAREAGGGRRAAGQVRDHQAAHAAAGGVPRRQGATARAGRAAPPRAEPPRRHAAGAPRRRSPPLTAEVQLIGTTCQDL